MTDARDEEDVRIPRGIRRIRGLAAGYKLTLETLWSFRKWSSTGTAIVWPTVETIAEATNESRRTIEDRLRGLVGLGWIRRARSSSGHDAFELAWPTDHGPTWELPRLDVDTAHRGDRHGPTWSTPRPNVVGPHGPTWTEQTENKQDQTENEHEEPRPPRPTHDQAKLANPNPIGTASMPGDATSRAADQLAEREATRIENARKVTQAAATMREQFPDRTEPKPGKCPLDLWAVVESHPASMTYAVDVHGNWAAKLGQLAAERSLTPGELAALLDFWESERAKYATARDRDAALDSGAFPPMADLWFYKSLAWVKWAIAVVRTPAGEAPPKRPSATTKPTQHNPALPNSTPYFAALRASGPEFAEGVGPENGDIPF